MGVEVRYRGDSREGQEEECDHGQARYPRVESCVAKGRLVR